jgi:hypothetical protein
MYLASTTNHIPTAVFDHFEDAEAFLCSIENVSLRFSCLRLLPETSVVYEVYIESHSKDSKRVLGYIRKGVMINPDYIVK